MSLIDQVYKKRSKKDPKKNAEKNKVSKASSSDSFVVEEKASKPKNNFNNLEEIQKGSKKDTIEKIQESQLEFFDISKLNNFKLFLNCKKLFDFKIYNSDPIESFLDQNPKIQKILFNNNIFSDFFYIKNESVVIPFMDLNLAKYLKNNFESFLDTKGIKSFYLGNKLFSFNDLDLISYPIDKNPKCIYCPFYIKKKEFYCSFKQ